MSTGVGAQVAGALSSGQEFSVKVKGDISDVLKKLQMADGYLERFKLKLNFQKKKAIVWYRTISRNLSLLLTLMGDTTAVQIMQQALQVWTLGVTISNLVGRARTSFGLAALGAPLEALKGMLFLSQATLLGAVQAQALQGKTRAEQQAANIARVRMWAETVL